MGHLALPQNLVFAAAPFLFAVAFRFLGFVGGTLMALALSLAALIAVAGLAHTAHQAQSTRASARGAIRRNPLTGRDGSGHNHPPRPEFLRLPRRAGSYLRGWQRVRGMR